MTTKFDEQRDSLKFECPECGAKVGKRCAMLGKGSYQSRRPHPDRASLAWQAWMAAQHAPTAAEPSPGP